MKFQFIFAVALAFSLSATAKSPAPKPKEVERTVSGRIAELVLGAMKAAGVKPVCKEDRCKYKITEFYSSTETDGCGGGTTGYEAKFNYDTNVKYEYKACDGELEGHFRRTHAPTEPNKADALNTVFGELDLSDSEGWTSFIIVNKLECSTYQNDPTYSRCEFTIPAPKTIVK